MRWKKQEVHSQGILFFLRIQDPLLMTLPVLLQQSFLCRIHSIVEQQEEHTGRVCLSHVLSFFTLNIIRFFLENYDFPGDPGPRFPSRKAVYSNPLLLLPFGLCLSVSRVFLILSFTSISSFHSILLGVLLPSLILPWNGCKNCISDPLVLYETCIPLQSPSLLDFDNDPSLTHGRCILLPLKKAKDDIRGVDASLLLLPYRALSLEKEKGQKCFCCLKRVFLFTDSFLI